MPTELTVPVAEWQAGYRRGVLGPEVVHDLLSSVAGRDPAWICCATHEQISAQFKALREPDDLPLYGVPFAVKDNIDAADWPTTAGCPAAVRNAARDATAVARLKAAGAILVGKTNLDQFATGLTGTRSPFGAVPNAFNPVYPSGGSSSGSASAVARGLVP